MVNEVDRVLMARSIMNCLLLISCAVFHWSSALPLSGLAVYHSRVMGNIELMMIKLLMTTGEAAQALLEVTFTE